MSAIDGNVEYYLKHPGKYSPSKIDKETWLSEQTRVSIKQIIEGNSVEQRKKTRQQFEQEMKEMKFGRRKRRVLFTDRKGQIHNRDVKTGRFVKVPQRVKKSTPSHPKKAVKKA